MTAYRSLKESYDAFDREKRYPRFYRHRVLDPLQYTHNGTPFRTKNGKIDLAIPR